MTKTNITAAKRKKILFLIREARKRAEGYRMIWQLDNARLLDDLADVAERYLEEKR